MREWALARQIRQHCISRCKTYRQLLELHFEMQLFRRAHMDNLVDRPA